MTLYFQEIMNMMIHSWYRSLAQIHILEGRVCFILRKIKARVQEVHYVSTLHSDWNHAE